MNLFARKSLVLLSLVLYLAASSSASVHAFTVLETQSAQDVMMSEQVVGSNCHNAGANHDSQLDGSLTCEIFCSVMAQAISVEHHCDPQNIACESNATQQLEPHISFDNQIEPKPPKHSS